MRWPWSRKTEDAAPRPPVAGRESIFKINDPFCPDHGIHCDGIAVGVAVDPKAESPDKMVVITLTLSSIPVATLLIPTDHADSVAAFMLKASTEGMVQ